MEPQKPSVGRIVHYVAYGTPGGEFPAGVCRAAVVTETYTLNSLASHPTGGAFTVTPDGWISDIGVCVLNPTGLFFNRGIPYNENNAPGTWHWPERT